MVCDGPHAEEDGFSAAPVHEAGLPRGKFLRRSGGEGCCKRGGCFGLRSVYFGTAALLFKSSGDAARQASASEARDYCIDFREILQNFETTRSIAGDELIILKRMDECARHSRMRA